MDKKYRLIYRGALALFFLIIFSLLLSLSVNQEIFRDQNQFIMSGKWLADEGLLPYADYPYFHPPYLVFVYGLIFQLTNYPLLAATIFSAICAWLTLILVFYLIERALPFKNHWLRFALAALPVLMIMTNPLFTATSGRAWNHDPQILLIVAAVAVFLQARERPKSTWYLFATGILLGLTTGVRLTLAVIPFLIIVSLYPKNARLKKRLLNVLSILSGFALALLPGLWLYLKAPAAFIFGHSQYTHLSTLYWQLQGRTEAMTLFTKLTFWLKEVVLDPQTLILTILGILLVALTIILRVRSKQPLPKTLPLLALLIFFMFISLLLPTPSWIWYFYAPIPFIVLLIFYAFADLATLLSIKLRISILIILSVLTICATLPGLRDYREITTLFHPNEWVPIYAHQQAQQFREFSDATGPVLTLAPLYAAEAGLRSYPEFTTSPFFFRVAPFLTPEQRSALKMIAPADLETWLRGQPPALILTGFEGADVEQPLIDYATNHGYQPHLLPTIITPAGVTVWTPQ